MTTKSTKSSLSWRDRLFFPLLAIVAVMGLTLFEYKREASRPTLQTAVNKSTSITNFELLISDVTVDRQRIELLEERFDYWSKRTVGRRLITLKPDSWQSRVIGLPGLPAVLEGVDWNKSEATLMLHCRPSVEFEVSFEDSDAWRIRIQGDTAFVEAPEIQIDDPLIPTDSTEHFVIEEEFFVDGEKEAQFLKRMLSEEIGHHVRQPEFLTPQRREACRRNLEIFMLNLFRATDKTQKVRHVYVTFPGEPNPFIPQLSAPKNN